MERILRWGSLQLCQSLVNELYSSEDTETIDHYLLSCQLYADRREILFDTVSSIIQNDVSTFRENYLCSLLLYGDPRFNKISVKSFNFWINH